MKISLIFIALALTQICQVYSMFGIDLSYLVEVEQFQCIRNQGFSFAVIRGYQPYGAVDPNCIKGLYNALNGGLIPLISMSPCRGKDPMFQVKEIMTSIPSNLYAIPFIKVDVNLSPGCSWIPHSYDSNCQFLADLVSAFQAYGKDPGIYASSPYVWNNIFGRVDGCPEVAAQPLWYANYDNNPSFDDFHGLGGWNTPAIKQFKGDANICGIVANLDFIPS